MTDDQTAEQRQESAEETARETLSDRQYNIWAYAEEGWTHQEIADHLFLCRKTVTREMHKIRKLLSDAMELDTEGQPRTGVTIAAGHDAWEAPDWTLRGAIGRMKERMFRKTT